MAAYDDAALPNDAQCEVATLLCPWALVRASAVAPDGITVVATHSGVGRWHRCDPGTAWAWRATWYIDFAGGSDEALGDVAAPLKTHAELVRRIGQHIGEGVSAITINFVGNYTGNLDWSGTQSTGNPSISYVGVRTVVYSGSVTAVTPYNPAASQAGHITDAAIPASWTASGLVGKAILLTSGAHSGYVGWIEKDLGGTLPKTANYHVPISSGGSTGEPAMGDTFDIITQTVITGYFLAFGRCNFYLYDLDIRGAGGWANCFSASNHSYVEAHDCLFELGTVSTVSVAIADIYGCRFADTVKSVTAYDPSTLYLDGCALECPAIAEARGQSSWNGGIQVANNTTSWNKAALTYVATGDITIVSGVWWGAFDFPAASVGISVERGHIASLIGLFWGVGNLGNYGLRCYPPSTIRYTALPSYGPNVLGDCLIGALLVQYASLPAVVPVQGCAIVSYP
jgi:hypothetical protein